MSLHTLVLAIHILAGSVGLLLGPLLLASRKATDGRAFLVGRAYVGVLMTVALSAFGLVALDPERLWWLLPMAAYTVWSGCGGWFAWRSGRAARAVRLLGGSYIALLTAFLVVSWGHPASWLIPGVLGAIVVETAAHRVGRAPAPTGGARHVRPTTSTQSAGGNP